MYPYIDVRAFDTRIVDGYPLIEAKKPVLFSEGLTSTASVAYLIVLMSAGFLTNFVPTGTVGAGTFLLYSLAGLLSFAGILYLLNPLGKKVAIAAASVLVLSSLAAFKSIFDVNPISQRVRELAIYFLGAWPFLFFIQVNSGRLRERLLKVLTVGLFGLSVFAIFQSIFADSLPLSLFALRGDNAFGVGDNQLRPTGLTGNPIIFSSILVLAAALFAALWLEKRKFRFLIALFCSLVANYVTYTRTSVVLVIPVLILVWLLHHRFRIKHKIIALMVVAVTVAGAQFLWVNGGDLILIQRLQSSNEESLVSTLGHFKQIQDAKDAIALHPLAGTGMGSEGDFVGSTDMIITDGAWWALLLEFGVPLTILIGFMLLITLIPVSKYVLRADSKKRALAIATLSFHAYILPANFINSALLGHISFGLYWVVLGLSFAAANNGPNPSPNLLSR